MSNWTGCGWVGFSGPDPLWGQLSEKAERWMVYVSVHRVDRSLPRQCLSDQQFFPNCPCLTSCDLPPCLLSLCRQDWEIKTPRTLSGIVPITLTETAPSSHCVLLRGSTLGKRYIAPQVPITPGNCLCGSFPQTTASGCIHEILHVTEVAE